MNSTSTKRKTGNASVRREKRGKRLGETNVSATHSHISSMVQRLAPRKILIEKRLKNFFIKVFKVVRVFKILRVLSVLRVLRVLKVLRDFRVVKNFRLFRVVKVVKDFRVFLGSLRSLRTLKSLFPTNVKEPSFLLGGKTLVTAFLYLVQNAVELILFLLFLLAVSSLLAITPTVCDIDMRLLLLPKR